MPKTLTYYYPNGNEPSAAKIFQDKSSQIRGFLFDREHMNLISNEEYSNNYAVYFLLSKILNKNNKTPVYVGKSTLGIDRINNHYRNKNFWNYCIMFISDNNVFDTNAIDYMEYYFIDLIKKSNQYELTNIELRDREPNINYFDKLTYKVYLRHINFLLKAEGIDLQSEVNINLFELENINQLTTIELLSVDETKDFLTNKNFVIEDNVFHVKGTDYDAKMSTDGKSFILEKGSVIAKPSEIMLTWSDNGTLYNRINKQINDYLSKGLIEDLGNTCKLLEDISFSSPSKAACFISGRSKNGWVFFKGLNELR